MKRGPFRHLGLKLLSLGLAVSLWIVVAGQEIVERALRVPLELQQFPAALELRGEAPASVDVRVRGASGALSRIAGGDIVAVLDLRAARPGRRLFHLSAEDVRAPSGMQVVQVSPATMAMFFEASATRRVRVAPRVEGEPAPGYAVERVDVNPGMVDVAGPAGAVTLVLEAATEPVSVAGARDRVTQSVTIDLADPAVRLMNPRPVTVTVRIALAPVGRTPADRPKE